MFQEDSVMTTTYSAQPEDQEPEIFYSPDSTDHPEAAGRHESADFNPANEQERSSPLYSSLREKIHRLARIVGLKLSLLSVLISILGHAAYSQTSPAGDEKTQARARELHKKLLTFDS